jgi:predicted GNAT family acetyltransferase
VATAGAPVSDRESPEDVVDDTHDNRFELGPEGESGSLAYRLNGNRLVLIHTEVPEALRGRGLGGRLVRAAVERAARESMTLVPLCPYAREWLIAHPDAAATVEIDWNPPRA